MNQDWETLIRAEFPKLTNKEIAVVMRALTPGDSTFYMSEQTQRAYREGIIFAVTELHPRRGELISDAIYWGRKTLAEEIAYVITLEKP